MIPRKESRVSKKKEPAVRDDYDVVIHHGTLYDGSGGPPRQGGVGIGGGIRLRRWGPRRGQGRLEIDAAGLAVAPGFINMLSWADESLIADGRSQSDIRQGVTLEVFGEGWSMGPLNAAMKKDDASSSRATSSTTSPGRRSASTSSIWQRAACPATWPRSSARPRCASTSWATTTARPRRPSWRGCAALVRQAMEEGALGVGSSLIYAPAFYADTDELVALCQRPRPSTAACTSRTCAARATGCSRRSTS